MLLFIMKESGPLAQGASRVTQPTVYVVVIWSFWDLWELRLEEVAQILIVWLLLLL